MMRQLTIALSLFAAITSQQTLAQTTDPVVMTVAGVPVSRSEFEYSYNKNNGEGVIDKLSVDEYVTLFINYKLKVAAALDAKLDTLSSFRQEYQMYRDQQVRPTMVTDAEVLLIFIIKISTLNSRLSIFVEQLLVNAFGNYTRTQNLYDNEHNTSNYSNNNFYRRG